MNKPLTYEMAETAETVAQAEKAVALAEAFLACWKERLVQAKAHQTYLAQVQRALEGV